MMEQSRILRWVAIPFSRGSSQPRDQTQVSYIVGRFFTNWATREAQHHASWALWKAQHTCSLQAHSMYAHIRCEWGLHNVGGSELCLGLLGGVTGITWDRESHGEPTRTAGGHNWTGDPWSRRCSLQVSWHILFPTLTPIQLKLEKATPSRLASVSHPPPTPCPGLPKRQACAPRSSPGEQPRPALAPGCGYLLLLNKSWSDPVKYLAPETRSLPPRCCHPPGSQVALMWPFLNRWRAVVSLPPA